MQYVKGGDNISGDRRSAASDIRWVDIKPSLDFAEEGARLYTSGHQLERRDRERSYGQTQYRTRPFPAAKRRLHRVYPAGLSASCIFRRLVESSCLIGRITEAIGRKS